MSLRFFVRFCWTISLIGFLYNLFTTYGSLQPTVGIHFGETILHIPRTSYFFFFLVFFLVLNITLYLFSKVFKDLPKSFFLVPFSAYWTQNMDVRKAANQILVPRFSLTTPPTTLPGTVSKAGRNPLRCWRAECRSVTCASS